jgi:hypothetical protein
VTRSGGFGPVQSPDGKYVYYAKGRSSAGLWRIDLETAREESVLETLKPTFWGLWALTAEGVYYLDTPPDGPPPCTLYFLDLATRESTPRTVLDGIKRVHYQGLAIAPDGKRLLYPQLNESAGEILLARNAF